MQRGREVFDGRVVWNVNSTAQDGGVAEMLISLLAYARGADINARWGSTRTARPPRRAGAMGREAKKRVLERFLGTRTLIQSIELYERYIRGQGQAGAGVDS